MKNFSLAIIVAACFALPAGAQTLGNTNELGQAATANAIIYPGAVDASAPDRVRNEFRTNQAASAPANIGSVAPSAGGCGAVDGWSVGVVIANGGSTEAKELAGCMLNLLTDRMDRLEVNATTQKFTGLSVMKLESWCLLPLYKQAIENSGQYVCKETRDERARALMGSNVVPVTAAPSNSWSHIDPTDKAVVMRRDKALGLR